MKEVNLKQIKLRRKEMRFTLMEMATELGFKNASTYYKYETGAYKFDANHIPLLVAKLKLKMKDIFLAA
jgi:transcriptional regulator with XRE-family HTH domain